MIWRFIHLIKQTTTWQYVPTTQKDKLASTRKKEKNTSTLLGKDDPIQRSEDQAEGDFNHKA